MRQELQELKDRVARNSGLVNSAVELVRGLAQQMKDNADDAEAIRAIASEVDTQAQALALAVPQNTSAQTTTGAITEGPQI